MMQNIRLWTRHLFLVFASVLLLAACGSPEKSDLVSIIKVMKDTGYTPEKNQQYQQRLQNAKSEAETRATVEEMLQIFEKLPSSLNALSLKTEEGKAIRDDLAQGMEKVLQGTKQALAVTPNDQAAAMAAQQLIMQGQQQMQQGQNKFMHAAGREGLKMEN